MDCTGTEDDEIGGEIFGNESQDEKENKDTKVEEGEIVDEAEIAAKEEVLYIGFSTPTAPTSHSKKMTVDFPGINAPIPENADERLWRAHQPPQPPQPTYGSGTRSSYYQRSVSFHTPQATTGGSPGPGPYFSSPYSTYRPREVRNLQFEQSGKHSWEETDTRRPASAPIAISIPKKADDEWELNFESTAVPSEWPKPLEKEPLRRAASYELGRGLPSLDTPIAFSPPDLSQMSPTGSGFGQDFKPTSGYDLPSPTPPEPRAGLSPPPLPTLGAHHYETFQSAVHYQQSHQAPTIVDTQPNEAWAHAQAALSSLQPRDQLDGSGVSHSHQGR